ncbi:MAG: hypothetical protein HY740_00805 [Chloroflexi bacterium]|nr:hypothetical protein [Chloroflexota bacterium]
MRSESLFVLLDIPRHWREWDGARAADLGSPNFGGKYYKHSERSGSGFLPRSRGG